MAVIPNASKDCFSHLKYMLHFLGYSANSALLKRLCAFCLLVISTLYPFAVISEIAKLKNNFDELINSLLFQIGYVLCLISTHCMYWNKFALHKLFDKMQVLSDLAKSLNNKEGYLLIEKYENFVGKQAYGGTMVVVVVITSSTIQAALISIQNEKWVFPLGSGINFIDNDAIRFFLQVFTYIVVTLIFYTGFFIYVNMLVLMSVHCQHLQKYNRSIIKITQTSENLVTDSGNNNFLTASISWKAFKIHLKKGIDYHTTINEIFTDIDNIYYFFIFTFFGGIKLMLCCLIYHGLTLPPGDINFFRECILIALSYILLVIVSFWGDKILTESDKIASSCYEVDFVGLDVRIQKSLLFIQFQKPKKLTIGKVQVLCLPTIVGVFQSVYTYYAFLRNINNK